MMPGIFDTTSPLIFVSTQLGIAVGNALLLPRLRRFPSPGRYPRVSVLVPARNEEKTIGACLRSLVNQDYPDFEVVVLDDGSEDGTARVIAGIESPRLRVIQGAPLPAGWNGKNWACQQLADRATGEVLFFTDADTRHQPGTVRQVVAALEQTGADLLSGITKNEVRSWGEVLTVPYIVWAMMAVLPLGVAYLWRRSQAFAAANGKLLVFRREMYRAIGGHQAVRDEATEDVALCRRVKRAGGRWRMVDATEMVSARMYEGFKSAFAGFSKNLFGLFDYRLVVALFVWLWMLLITWYPLGYIVRALVRAEMGVGLQESVAAAMVSGLVWLVVALKARLPWYLALIYPLPMTLMPVIGLWSVVLTVAGKNRWKERRLVRHRVRII